MSTLFFADDIVLLGPLGQDQWAPPRKKSWLLNGKRVACPRYFMGGLLPEVEEFKEIGVLFMREGLQHENGIEWHLLCLFFSW